MVYTVRISGNSPQAKGLIQLLKSLQKDYQFIEVTEENQYADEELSPEWVEELEKRAAYMAQHPNEGKTWEDVKKNYR